MTKRDSGMKPDLSDPQQVTDIIQRFKERTSSNFNSTNLKQFDDKSSGKFPGSGSVSS